MATITRYVDPNAAAGGDGTTNGLSGSTCAYASMAIWEAAQQQDLTDGGGDIAECICDSNGGAADTTAVTIDGWTTSSTAYISIHTPTTSRHDGKWNTGKYRIEVSNSICVNVLEADVFFDGLQVSTGGTSGSRCFSLGSSGTMNNRVSRCIIRDVSTNRNGVGLHHSFNDSAGATRFWNNVIYDFSGTNGFGIEANTFRDCYSYNNTLHNCSVGIKRNFGNSVAINNLCKSCATSATGTFAAGTDYNSTDNASMGYTVTGGGNTHDRTSQTFTFVDEGVDDFHLASSDAGALDFGVSDPGSGLFSDDIDGETRSGSWDIGADEYVSSGGAVYDESIALGAIGSLSQSTQLVISESISLASSGALAPVGPLTTGGAVSLSASGSLSAASTLMLAEFISFAAESSLAANSGLIAGNSVPLGAAAALSPASSLIGGNAISLGATGALAPASNLNTSEAILLAVASAVAQTGGLLLADTITLASSGAISASAALVASEAIALSGSAAFTAGGSLSAIGSVALNASTAIAAAAQASLSDAIVLAAGGTISANSGASIIDEFVGLSASASIASAGSLILSEALGMNVAALLSASGNVTLIEQIALDIAGQIQATAQLIAQGMVSHGVTAAHISTAQANMYSILTLGVAAALQSLVPSAVLEIVVGTIVSLNVNRSIVSLSAERTAMSMNPFRSVEAIAPEV